MSSKRTTTAAFIRALYNLTRKGTPFVDWSADGTTFRILDIKRFASEVLPHFFKHSNMASFQRQLNYFSFKKWTKNNRTLEAISKKGSIAEFHHPYFTRDMDESLLSCFRRKVASRSFEPLMDVYAQDYDTFGDASYEHRIVQSAGREKSSTVKVKKEPLRAPCRLPKPHVVNDASPRKTQQFPSALLTPPPVLQFEPIRFAPGPHHPHFSATGPSTLRQGTCIDNTIDISWGHCDSWQSDAPHSGSDCDWLTNFDWETHGDLIPTAGIVYQTIDGAGADTSDFVVAL
ncbi:hypothetical protein AaE_004495 [Aphanomyces astaci]|uniref:HSF-type DNA-binding domain-containing protein n=1 Tax=Aphanomyces astaci TaxID=112090 RepID=A0A6A5AN87_APHAT|nr:hypothetical protein AaE_004495 [Aphanomyces astaci]